MWRATTEVGGPHTICVKNMRVGENLHGSKFRAGAEGNQLNFAKNMNSTVEWFGANLCFRKSSVRKIFSAPFLN